MATRRVPRESLDHPLRRRVVPYRAGAAAIITSPTGIKYRYAARLSFALESDRCTNNIAEYEAVILGLCKLRALGVTTCIIRTDSKVVADQVEKEYSAKDPVLMLYLTAVRSLKRQFKGFTLQHVDRAKNEEADALAKAAAKGEALPSYVFYHVIGTPVPQPRRSTNNSGHRRPPHRQPHHGQRLVSPNNSVPAESRLEGGVNRANLKFIKLSTTTSRVSVRNINESEREGGKQIASKQRVRHKDLFYRGSVFANLLPVEVVTKTGSLSTLSLSQTVT
jgi:ribonuclease HI